MKFKRLLSGALAAAVALSTMALTPFTTASADDSATTDHGAVLVEYGNILWSGAVKKGEDRWVEATLYEDNCLVLSGNGDPSNWISGCTDFYSELAATNHYQPWRDIRETITSVVVEEGVTALGHYLFYGMTNLQSVSISNTVVKLFQGVFEGCTSLTSITIPDSVVDLGTLAFLGCTSLESVTLPDSIVDLGGSTFYGCTSLESVTLPDGATEGGTALFQNCTSLTSVNIPSGFTIIPSSMFDGCKNLPSVTIPDGVTEIGGRAFWECFSLQNITIPDGCTSIGIYAFTNCRSFTSVTIPDSVTSIGIHAFHNCYALEDVTISNSVTEIPEGCFQGCRVLKNITIPDSVTSIGESAFTNCLSEDLILYIEGEPAISGNPFSGCTGVIVVYDQATYDKIAASDYGTATLLLLKKGIDYTSLISAVADGEAVDTRFYTEETVAALTEAINAGKAVLENTEATQDEVDNAATAISKAIEGLTEITLDTSSLETAISNGEAIDTSLYTEATVAALTEAIDAGKAVLANTEATQAEIFNAAAAIDKAIEGLVKEKEIYDISENQDGSVTAILYYSDGSLVISGTGATKNYNVNASDNKTPWNTDGNYTKVTSVTIESGVTSLGNDLLAQLPNMESVSIPDTVTSIGSRCFGTDFRYPNKLTSVVIPESVTSIGDNAFAYSASLVSVTLPSGLTSISDNLFRGCTSLTTVNIPDTVTSIGSYAFYDCSSLTSVTLPDSVTSIGENAFHGCSSLTSVNIPSSLTTLGARAFSSCNLTGKVVIPEGVTVIGDNAFGSNSSADLEIYVMGALTTVGGNPFSGGAGKIYVYDAKTYSLISVTNYGAFEIIYDGEVDISILEAAIAKAEALKESDYTADTWAAVASALEAAKAELANEDMTPTSFMAATTALTNAIDGLVEAEKYLSYIYKNGTLTDIVSCSVTDDMAGATKVKVNFDCASDVSYNPNAAIDFLINNNWDNNYEFKGTYGYEGGTKGCSETIELLSALVKGNSFTLTGYTYAWGNAADYVYAVSSVDFLDADGNVIYTINAHTVMLNTTALESAITKGAAVDADKYTAESYAVLTSAISAGKTVLANAEATQEDIDAAAKAITDAIAALELNIVTGTVTGTINVSDEEVKTEMTVVAVAADGTKTSVTAASMGTYKLENLEAGDYTLTISGGKYAPRSYEITVEAGDNAQDVKLNPYGDINGDGDITTADVGLANSHAKGVRTLTDYDFVCADVKIDGSISTADVGMINSHAKGVKTLW